VSAAGEGLAVHLRTLKLPSFARDRDEVARRATEEGWPYDRYLLELTERELLDREERRVERLHRQAHLPPDKTRQTLETERLPAKARRQLAELFEGHFLDRAENVLAFGLPGRGKTHCLSAIGHELVHRGRTVLFLPAYQLVQRLLVAKRDLLLEAAIRRMDRFEAVVVDDIGYVQQSREEVEVLFTFLAERYERRSVLISSNLVFSEWDRIFKDPMTTACAIDRIVHHATILELTGSSFREDAAKRRRAGTPAAGKVTRD
jgi:DNA replication protein DnaC